MEPVNYIHPSGLLLEVGKRYFLKDVAYDFFCFTGVFKGVREVMNGILLFGDIKGQNRSKYQSSIKHIPLSEIEEWEPSLLDATQGTRDDLPF